jgi:tetratricopeptide (TPR) repeat protein
MIRQGRSADVAIAALASTLLMLGCARSSKSGEPIRVAGKPGDQAASSALLPTALPDLSGMAGPVQDQLRAQYQSLASAQRNPATSHADLAAAYGGVGRLFLAAEAFAESEPYYLNAHALAPDDFRWSYYLAHVYRLEGESARATTWFEQTLEVRPDEVAALVWLGDMYLDQGRPDAAGSLFSSALAKQPRTAAAELGLGRVALEKRDYTRAIDHLERALAIDRRATVAHYPLAMAYRAVGKIEQAEAHLRQRGDVEIGPPDPLMQEVAEVLHSAVAYENRGDRAIAAGEFATAVSHFRRALDLAPDRVSLRQKLATALSLTGDVPGALIEFQEVLRRSPDFAPAHYSLGVLLLADGQFDLAIGRFSTAVRSDPTYLQARLQLANTLRRRRRFEPSAREYANIIKMDPRVGEARFGQALTLVGLKRYEEARDRLLEGMKLFPDRLEFIGALARLYATAPEAQVRDGGRARMLAQALIQRRKSADAQETMAMALAEAGEFEAAASWQREAIAAAEGAGQHELAVRMADNLRLYQRRLPCRTAWRDDPAWDPS